MRNNTEEQTLYVHELSLNFALSTCTAYITTVFLSEWGKPKNTFREKLKT